MSDPKLILSLTSFPARIRFVPRVLESLRAQTRPADAILLYLSEDQFPGREADLPEELTAAAEAGSLVLRFVPGDLKPHKKYLYAFREYPDAYIVTVDDDALYAPGLLEDLWQTHLRYPDAVAAGRTHLITLDASGAPRPYAEWVRRVTGFEQGSSLQLLAVGVGGVLYDPRLFPPELYDEEAIRATCLEADDLWLKAMELAAGIPVVRSAGAEYLRLVPGSQESSLYHVNVNQNRNDELLARVREWTTARFGRDMFTDWARGGLPAVRTEEELLAFLLGDRKRRMDGVTAVATDLEISLKRTSDRLSALEQTAEGLRNTVDHLKQDKEHLNEYNAKLKNDRDRLRQERDAVKADLDLLRNSSSYKLGHALTAPIRMIKK